MQGPCTIHDLLTGQCACGRLSKKPVSEKKVAITVFSFPPDKGNVGTAAYLNVFGSIFKVLQDLKADGYNIGELPEDEMALMQKVGLHICMMQVSHAQPVISHLQCTCMHYLSPRHIVTYL